MISMPRPFAAKIVTALVAAASLVAVAAPNASARTLSSTIWNYYDSHGHLLGTAGLNCAGGVFEYDGELPEGGYARHTTMACSVGGFGTSVTCYSVGQNYNGQIELEAVSCSDIP